MHYSRFFKNTKHVFWRTLVIEVAKLYSNKKNDKYNILRLLTSLSKSGEFRKANIDEEILLRWSNVITQNKEVIDILVHLRDSFYGHTDTPEKKAKINYEDLTIEQVEPLIQMAENIIQEVNLKVFDAQADCRVEFVEKDFEIITILANHKHNKIKSMLGPRSNFKKSGKI